MDPSDLEDLSPEELEQLVALGVIPDKMSHLDRQYQQAAKLRNTEMPGMEGNGRVMVAASPLAHLSAGIDRYMGMKDMKSIEAGQGSLMREQVSGRNKYLQALLSGGRGPKPQSIQQPMAVSTGIPDANQMRMPTPKMNF